MKVIVIIEDEDILRENLESLLDVEGFKVYSCPDGESGLSKITSVKPDLVLCDIMLPDMDGYKIVKSVKENKETKFIPFIFLTAKAEMKDLREGMNLGADDYLTKPYNAKELIEVVNKRISLSKKTNGNSQSKTQESGKVTIEDHIFVQNAKNVKPVQIKKIICILAAGEYSEIYTDDGSKSIVRKLMKAWEQILPDKTFLRIHQSIIINLNYISKVEKWFNNSFKITLQKYDAPLISSRRYSSRIRSKLLS